MAPDGREYLDFVMALGSVALGYADPEVTDAVINAARRGAVGSLAPELEEQVAERLVAILPGMEQVRFLKSGAEAVAAAVRIARAASGRDRILGCGYHGWLDWSQPTSARGVPDATTELFAELPFNDSAAACHAIRAAGSSLAAVVVEPVIHGPPEREWLATLRAETSAVGALLIYDEIKTAIRVGPLGAAGRWGGSPDLIVVGKAIANGYPLAAVAGRVDIMRQVEQTWISSTLATEFVSLAAADAVLRRAAREDISAGLQAIGTTWWEGLNTLAGEFPELITAVEGLPEMNVLTFVDEQTGAALAVECARRGLLLKRSAYNFVSLAHDRVAVATALGQVRESLQALSV